MAPLTGPMALIERDLLDALRMTILANHRARELDAEVVRFVTLDAIGTAVAAVIGSGELVAAAASARAVAAVLATWVRVMASRATSRTLGVVRMNFGVATFAGALWSSLHVMRRVTAGAAIVLRDAPASQDALLGVTRSALHGLLSLKRVRPMTAQALTMPAREESGSGHDRLLLGVAVDARRARVERGGVLVLVARLASF